MKMVLVVDAGSNYRIVLACTGEELCLQMLLFMLHITDVQEQAETLIEEEVTRNWYWSPKY